MREIKFRVWDKIQKEWIDGEWIKISLDGVVNNFHLDAYSGYYDTCDNCIISEFTGLRDKKRTKEFPDGQPIFEGDIVKDGEIIMQVVYNEKYASFSLRNPGWMYDHFFNEASRPEDCEIIGNIYEHSYLLK